MKTLLASILLLCSSIASAQWYGIIGAGQTKFPTYYEPGLWQQMDMGFAFVADETSQSWALGIGRRLNRNWAVEFNYTDLGKYNSFGRYTDDPSYAAACAPADCFPTSTGWHRGHTRVFELSALYERSHMFGRIGGGYYMTKFRTLQSANNEDNKGRQIREDFPGQGFDAQALHGVLGTGLHFGAIRLEHQWRNQITGSGNGYKNARTWLISAEVPF